MHSRIKSRSNAKGIYFKFCNLIRIGSFTWCVIAYAQNKTCVKYFVIAFGILFIIEILLTKYFMNIAWCIIIPNLEVWDVHTAIQMFYSVAKNKDDYIVNVLLPKWILAKIHLHKYIFLNNSLWYSMSLIMQCSLTQGRIYRDSTFSYKPRSIFSYWNQANNLWATSNFNELYFLDGSDWFLTLCVSVGLWVGSSILNLKTNANYSSRSNHYSFHVTTICLMSSRRRENISWLLFT